MSNHENIKLKLSTYLCFLSLLIYGALLLIVSYTQEGLATILFPNSRGNIVYALLAQSIGLIVSTILLSRVIHKINIRYLFSFFFTLSAIGLFLISYLNKLHLEYGSTKIIIAFLAFSFLFGCGIGPISPLVSTYISAKYKGHQQSSLQSISLGLYGIGAGILPLCFSSIVLKIGHNPDGSATFESVRYFYYIAAILSLVGAIIGSFINYKHSIQLASSKIISKKHVSFSLWKPLIIAIGIMGSYMIVESVFNYLYVNLAQTQGSNSFDPKNISFHTLVNATRAFGLLVMTQGIWRIFSGLFLVHRLPKSCFIFASFSLTLVGVILILCGLLKYVYMQYIIAVIIGISLGNGWPLIYSYAITIDQRRATFIGIAVNITSTLSIPLCQVIVAPIWSHIRSTNSIDNPLFYAPIYLALALTVFALGLVGFSMWYFKHFKENKKG